MQTPVRTVLGFTMLAAVLLPRLSAQDAAMPGPGEIYVDNRCHVLISGPAAPGNSSAVPIYRANRYVCHIESPHTTLRREERMENGVVKHSVVRITEREYVLSGPSDAPVTFYVQQPLPKGGEVDSDPQPVSVENSVAIFRVEARPGQTVRLHVGIRD